MKTSVQLMIKTSVPALVSKLLGFFFKSPAAIIFYTYRSHRICERQDGNWSCCSGKRLWWWISWVCKVAHKSNRKVVKLLWSFDDGKIVVFVVRRKPTGLNDTSRFPHLFAELVQRGWQDEDLEKLAGRNLVRVFREVELVSQELQESGIRPYDDLIPEEDIPEEHECRTDFNSYLYAVTNLWSIHLQLYRLKLWLYPALWFCCFRPYKQSSFPRANIDSRPAPNVDYHNVKL